MNALEKYKKWLSQLDGIAQQFGTEVLTLLFDESKDKVFEKLDKSLSINDVLGSVNAITDETGLIQNWYCLRDLSKLKGINYKTLANNKHLQPRGGKEDGYIGGKRAWRREAVIEWLEQDDKTLKRLYKAE